MRNVVLFVLAAFVLVLSCKKKDGGEQSNKPLAKFSISGYEVPTPCTITFINTSINATSYTWDFGDGTTSTDFNPTHTYNLNGSYLLKLKVAGPGGENAVCKLVAIEPPPPANKSAFSYYLDKCQGTPVAVAFKTINPNSTNPIWDFGSGLPLLDRDPITQFLLPGDYTVKYSTSISGVRDTVIRIIRID